MDMSNANLNKENKEINHETVINSNEAIEESLDSEMGMSIDDEEIRQLFEQEPLWGTLANTTVHPKELEVDRSTSNDQMIEAIEELNVIDSDHEDQPISDLGNIPEYPDFSIDDLPIFPENVANRLKNYAPNLNDNSPKPQENLSQSKESLTNDILMAPNAPLNDFAFDLNENMQQNSSNKSVDSSSIDFELPSGLDIFGRSPLDSPEFANGYPESNDTSIGELPDLFKNMSSQANDITTDDPPAPSEQRPNEMEEIPTTSNSRSLRQRNAIQLNPFTLEYARYKNMLGKAKFKTWSNTQHTHEDTQALQATLDDSIYSQYIPSTETSHVEIPKRKSAPSNGKSKPTERTFLQEELSSFEKYGLDKLILPPVEQESAEKQKDKKVITFKKKRKSKHHRITPRKIPRLQESLSKDIFAFEENPQSVFNITDIGKGKEKEIEHINMSDHDDMLDEDLEVEESETEENSQLNFRRRKRRLIRLDSDEDEEEQDSNDDTASTNASVEELPQEQINKIYTFPKNVGSSREKVRRLERKITDGDIVPVVADEYEYRDYRRPRTKLQDVIKKKEKALRGVLPASFLKVNQKEILEEGKSRTVKKKRPKPSKPATTEVTSRDDTASTKPISDVFAAFQSSEDEESVILENHNSASIDGYVVREEQRVIVPEKRNVPSKPKQRRTTFIQQNLDANVQHSNKSAVPKVSPAEPSHSNSDKYPLNEAMEYNRIRRLYSHSTKKASGSKTSRQKLNSVNHGQSRNSNTNPSRKNTSHLPANNKSFETNQTSNHVEDTEETEEHDPFEESDIFFSDTDGWDDTPFGQYSDNDMDETNYDDDHDDFERENEQDKRKYNIFDENASATYYYKYPSHDIQPSSIKEDKRNQGQKLPPLESVAKKIRNAVGFDVTRIKKLTSTVYLHKQLLVPLLSSNRNEKQAYAHLKKDYEHLEFFKTHFLWTDIVPKESDLISSLFFKMSKDIQLACLRWYDFDDNAELPGHDQFYTFVSICLALWIPCLPDKGRQSLTHVFMTHIRNLAWLLQKQIRQHPRNELPWKILTKLAIYILDWTCRLHHLGSEPMDWSVVAYTQILLDFLLYAGYEETKSKQCLVEAWICLIQVLSVTSRSNEFSFNEFVFIRQLKTSIKSLSITSENQEVEIKRNTELWAEVLNYLLDHYISA